MKEMTQMFFVLVVLHLVLLHTVDGRETLINPEQVASMTHRNADRPNKLLVDDVECVIELSNGKFVSVIEHCDEVQRKLEEAGK
jgi:uncharacterized protein YlzI (FlbEa/FlbD family)